MRFFLSSFCQGLHSRFPSVHRAHLHLTAVRSIVRVPLFASQRLVWTTLQVFKERSGWAGASCCLRLGRIIAMLFYRVNSKASYFSEGVKKAAFAAYF